MWAWCWCTRRRFERAHGDAFGAYTPFSPPPSPQHTPPTNNRQTQVHWNTKDETPGKSQETTDNTTYRQQTTQRETTPDTRHNGTKEHDTCDQSHTRRDKTGQGQGQGQHKKIELVFGNNLTQAEHKKSKRQHLVISFAVAENQSPYNYRNSAKTQRTSAYLVPTRQTTCAKYCVRDMS